MSVTVSKGSTKVSACIELLSARVLQFETLRALTIMLEVEEAMEDVESISSLPNNEFLESIFEKEDVVDSHMICSIVISNFFL